MKMLYMKSMKSIRSVLFAGSLLAVMTGSMFAQNNVPTPPTFIKGDININFETRQKQGVEKITDKYNLNLNISNSILLKGLIEYRPFIKSTFSANQNAQLSYDVDTDIVNPKNPTQTRNVGKILGIVPISEQNTYDFTNSNAKINVFGAGNARGFESKFSGTAIGKPPIASGFAAIKQDAVRLVNGKGGSVTLTKYDKLEFVNIQVPAGPVGIYPETVISGNFLYDYSKGAWYLHNVTISYTVDNKRIQDTLTGNIRWKDGQYIFDLKINEPLPSEAAVFSAPADESAFFEADSESQSVTGVVKYIDTKSGDRVIGSKVSVDLTGTKINKQQITYVAKIVFLVLVVPFNAE